jgi:hypothetical protein
MFYHLMHLPQAESLEGTLLTLGAPDTTSDLLYSYSFHGLEEFTNN